MNKIERAIYDVKLHIKDKEREVQICLAQLESLKSQLKTLEVIYDDNSIPNEVNKKPNV